MVNAEHPTVCIDRVLKRDLKRLIPRTQGPDGRIRAIAPIGKTWMNGVTLHVKFLGGTANEQAITQEQAGWWTQWANLTFAFDNAPDAEIRISFDPNDGAWSYIGTDCLDREEIPPDKPTMNLGFLDNGTAAHEFGHAIGLFHEHQNPARGIRWNEEVVIKEMSEPPNNWDEITTRHNILDKYSIDQIKGSVFDPNSIMLYPFPESWTLNGIYSKPNTVLSRLDKEFIGQLYPKVNKTVSNAVRLKVNAIFRTQASISMFGEEDLYRFRADSDGKYVIDTRGPTDVVMKLYGPNSETALIEDDDDSGCGTNALISAYLNAGDYFVQIRHYDQESGKGDYSIKVRRI